MWVLTIASQPQLIVRHQQGNQFYPAKIHIIIIQKLYYKMQGSKIHKFSNEQTFTFITVIFFNDKTLTGSIFRPTAIRCQSCQEDTYSFSRGLLLLVLEYSGWARREITSDNEGLGSLTMIDVISINDFMLHECI